MRTSSASGRHPPKTLHLKGGGQGGEDQQRIRTPSAKNSTPERGSPPPLSVQPHPPETLHLKALPLSGAGANRTYGRRRAVWHWDALVGPYPRPRSSFAGEPVLSLSKRGDQSHARRCSHAVQAMLARMFCRQGSMADVSLLPSLHISTALHLHTTGLESCRGVEMKAGLSSGSKPRLKRITGAVIKAQSTKR